MEHTKGEWIKTRLKGNEGWMWFVKIKGSSGICRLLDTENAGANAKHICRCVNFHDALQAKADLFDELVKIGGNILKSLTAANTINDCVFRDMTRDRLKELLAKAEKLK